MLAGRRPFVVQDHAELKEEFNFSPEENYTLTDVIGLERPTFRMPETCIMALPLGVLLKATPGPSAPPKKESRRPTRPVSRIH